MPDVRIIHWHTFGQTVINPFALGLTLLAGVLILLLPRRHVLLPFLLVACFLPVAQRIVIATLDFNMIRILLLFVAVRIFGRGEHEGLRLGPIDQAFLVWLVLASLAYIVREHDFGAVVYRLGIAFDAIGSYFFMRCVLRSRRDLEQVIAQFAIVTVPMAVVMSYEKLTGHNLFAVFGGVSAETIVRDGKFRCQGAFSHPILAGTFGAMAFALAMGPLLRRRGRSALYLAASVGAVLIVIYSASSGPLMALAIAVVAWSLWPLRIYTRQIRWGLASAAIGIQLMMHHPIYFLIGRISDVVGGGGYFRVQLIDNAVQHFTEWVLIGSDASAHWGWGLQDTTNQYVAEALNGGLLALIAFVVIIVLGYRWIGRTLRVTRRRRDLSQQEKLGWQLLLWGVGVALTVHVVSFVSVSYFGQMQVLWFMFIALSASLWPAFTLSARRAKARSGKVRARARQLRAAGDQAARPASSPSR